MPGSFPASRGSESAPPQSCGVTPQSIGGSSYLADLESKGVRIPHTQIIRSAGPIIVKPAISASAHSTHLMDGDVMVQEFVREIVDDGEWSLVFFDRVFSHAVKKTPKAGDFRVQEELGGSSIAATPNAALLAEAQRIVDLVAGELWRPLRSPGPNRMVTR